MSFDGYTLPEILDFSGGKLANPEAVGGREIRVRAFSPLETAKDGEIAFFFSKKYQNDLLKSAPSILITGDPFVSPLSQSGLPLWKKTAVIACADPYYAMAVLSEKFAHVSSSVAHVVRPTQGAIHPSAVIDPAARVATTARIGPHCVLEKNAEIGDGSVLYPGCFVGPGASIGKDCVLFPRVTLYERVRLGDRVRIHAGAVLGADGFGYAPEQRDGKTASHRKIYHLGTVTVGDDTEIGANTCIDRGTLKDTVIGPKCKIDDHVMIGHNARLGEGVIVCGSVGMAGSVEIGDFVYIGGLSGIPNGVTIGRGAKLGGGTFVSGDVPAEEIVGGHPHRKFRDFLKLQVLLSRLLEERRK